MPRLQNKSLCARNAGGFKRLAPAGRIEETKPTNSGAELCWGNAFDMPALPAVFRPAWHHRPLPVDAETHGLSPPVMIRRQARLAKSRTTRCSNGT